MERREISNEVFKKVLNRLPEQIINMLPESPEKLLKYAKRVEEIKYGANISDDIKRLMKEYLLNDEEYLMTFYYVMAITFYNKHSVQKPEMAIVAAQTGSGKSNLTAKLLRQNSNFIFVDSDKYKHFRYDAKAIAEKYPVIYPYLTGPDCYDHAANVYQYALDNNYNIIKETAPSKNKGLIEVSEEEEKKYKISLHILAVSKINSMLSVHERYELQITHGLKTAKLTPIKRHNESYDALIENIKDVENSKYKDSIYVYTRGLKKNKFEPNQIYPGKKYKNSVEAIEAARMTDEENTKKEFEDRYNLIKKQMDNRNAPKDQYEQLDEIKEMKEK